MKRRTPERATLMLRLSDARIRDARKRHGEGVELSEEKVERQEVVLRRKAADLGWDVAHVIVENNTSAYKRRRVTLPNGRKVLRVIRPEFETLLDLMDRGETDGVIAVDLDRATRDPRTLEDLIDGVEMAVEQYGSFPVKDMSGSLDLNTDNGVTMARMMVAVGNKSSRDTARRQKDKQLALAEAGLPSGGGRRRFGFEKDAITHRPDEAEVIRWAAAGVLEGRSIRSMCLEMDAKGIAPVLADKWSGRTLTSVLTNPRIAGLRSFKGEVVGQAAWKPIIDKETFERVKATIENTGLVKAQPVLKYFAAGLLFCCECGTTLYTNTGGKARSYFFLCDKKKDGCGGVSIHGQRTQDLITEQVLEYFAESAPTLPKGKAARVQVEQPVNPDLESLAEDKALLDALALRLARKQITLSEWEVLREEVQQRIDANSPKVVVPSVAPAVAEVLREMGKGHAAAVWEQATPVMKRDVARAILGQRGYKGWRVARATSNRFDKERLSLEPA